MGCMSTRRMHACQPLFMSGVCFAGNMAAVFPKYLSDWTTQKMREGMRCAKPTNAALV